MQDSGKTKLAYVDAVALERAGNRLYVATAFSGSEVNASRMLLLMDKDEWMSHDVNSRVVSVHASPGDSEMFALGRDGLVSIATNANLSVERIAEAGTGAGKAGYVSQVRFIDGEAYVCGDLHQVYKRIGSVWTRIDQQIRIHDLMAVGRGLNSIDGVASNDIYAVGDRGVIFHFDGKGWTEIISPTNSSLERVKCVSRDLVYACGSNGVLLRGKLDQWEVLHAEELEGHDLWDLEWFNDRLFVSANVEVLAISGDQISKAMTEDNLSIQGHHLTSAGHSLWSISANRLYKFDGNSWSLAHSPGND